MSDLPEGSRYLPLGENPASPGTAAAPADLPAGSRYPFKVPQFVTPSTPRPQGLLRQGNIDLSMQPRIPNEDGSTSSVRSASFNDGTGEVLIPTVSRNRLLSMPEAIQQYKATGQHLGVFSNPDQADAYASQLHNDYAAGKIAGQPSVEGNNWGAKNVQGGNQPAF